MGLNSYRAVVCYFFTFDHTLLTLSIIDISLFQQYRLRKSGISTNFLIIQILLSQIMCLEINEQLQTSKFDSIFFGYMQIFCLFQFFLHLEKEQFFKKFLKKEFFLFDQPVINRINAFVYVKTFHSILRNERYAQPFTRMETQLLSCERLQHTYG